MIVNLLSFILRLRADFKYKLLLLSLLTTLSGICELLSLGSLIPVINSFIGKNNVQFSAYLGFLSKSRLYDLIIQHSLILFISLVLFSSFLRLATLKYGLSLSALIGSRLSGKLFLSCFSRPYISYNKSNSSRIIHLNTDQVNRVVTSIDLTLQFLTSLLIAFIIFVGLMIVNPFITLLVTSMSTASYIFFHHSFRLTLVANSLIYDQQSSQKISVLQEAFASIRSIKLKHNLDYYYQRFYAADTLFREARIENDFLATAPRYLFESLALLYLIISGFIAYLFGLSISLIGSTLIIIAYGFQRLLPLVQKSYACYSCICSATSSCEAIYSEFPAFTYEADVDPLRELHSDISGFGYRAFSSLVLDQISYSHPGQSGILFDSLSLSINRGDRLGISGASGIGKSTLADIICGLIFPASGNIIVNGAPLCLASSSFLRDWQSSIAYVPQYIYLPPTSILQYISGVSSPSPASLLCIYEVCRICQIHSFISSLPYGYSTVLSERGSGLSGGQRQRLALAQALFARPEFLILDEATSALDASTEGEFFREFSLAYPDLTVLIIAHTKRSLALSTSIYDLSSRRIL